MLKIVVFGKNLVQKSDEETLTLLKTVKPNNILPQPKKRVKISQYFLNEWTAKNTNW